MIKNIMRRPIIRILIELWHTAYAEILEFRA